MSLYSDYKYVRPKQRTRNFLLFVFVITVCLTVIIFSISRFLRDERQASLKVELPGLEFHAVGTRGFNNKAKAMELAYEMRGTGGAGFVSFDGEWFVVQEIGVGNLEFSVDSVHVNLAELEHKEVFNKIMQSFERNKITLSGLLSKPAREVAAEALQLYNELSVVIDDFDKIQGNTNSAMYSEALFAANKHLLVLFLLSTEKDAGDIGSALKHCICSINFAYLELLTSLG